jgi:glycosyltransferase involved in cell wall biosynthesis
VSRTVDVIVPCYNYGSYLACCVRSLLDQQSVAVRVLVIDDHSGDNTPEIGLGLARADERVTFRRHEKNQGHIATFNEGFAWASADYLLLISADDLLTPGALKRAVDALEANPRAAFASGRQISFVDTLQALPASPASAGCEIVEGRTFIERLCASADNPVATPTVVVRTSVQHQAGGYKAALPHTADLEMWLRLAALGDVISLDAYQAYKRMHRSNMQHAFVMKPAGDLVERHQAFEAFLTEAGAALPNVDRLRSAMTGALAGEAICRGAELFDLGRPQDARRLLSLAIGFDRRVQTTGESLKLAIKVRMGQAIWRLVRPAARRLFRRTPPLGHTPAPGRV